MAVDVFAVRKGDNKTLLRPGAEELSSLMADPDVVVWVDIMGVRKEDEKLLTDVLGLHPLMVEDILGESHPKIEEQDDLLYVIVHGIDPDHKKPDDLATVEMDVVLCPRFILTHHDRPMRSTTLVRARIEKDPSLLCKGTAFLAHAILDYLTDFYLPLMEGYSQMIDELELKIVNDPSGEGILEKVFDLKHSLQRIRRVGIHQKELLQRLSSGNVAQIPEESLLFFRDVCDHFVRVSDLADSYREHVSSALQAYLSMQSHRLNEVMKVLTLLSTIMLPLTFIAGIYGMNFDQMPELHWAFGYPFALILMGVVAIVFVIFFKRRRWI